MHYPTQSSQQSCKIGTIIFSTSQKQETGKEETQIPEVHTYCYFVGDRKAKWEENRKVAEQQVVD